MKQRILRILMALVLLLGLLPTAALAEEPPADGALSDVTLVTAGTDITRAQMAEMVYEHESLRTAIDTLAGGGSEPQFEDLDGCTADQIAAITALYKARIISGTAADTFSPNNTVTRGEFAVVLWRATGCRSNTTAMNGAFTDRLESWYAPAVNCFYGAGLVNGTVSGKFDGDLPMPVVGVNTFLTAYATNKDAFIANTVSGSTTRAEMTVEFYEKFRPELSKLPVTEPWDDPFTDLSGCTTEQVEAIRFFYEREIILGTTETTFHPHTPVSNFQIAALLQRCAIKEIPAEPAAVFSMVRAVLLADQSPFAFLTAQGLDVTVAESNPNAPALTTTLATWRDGLTPDAPILSAESDSSFTEALEVTISAAAGDESADLYYTLDGSDPTTGSAQYLDVLTITETTTVKAIAVKNNLVSEVTAATYTKADRAPEQTPPAPGYDSVDSEHTYSVQKVEGVNLSRHHAEAGEIVTLTITDDAIIGLIVTDRKGRELQLTDEGNGKYSFEMPKGTVTITPVYAKAEVESVFTDVEEDHWALDAIRWVYDEGLMTGSAADVFHPEGRVTRQQVWMILARMFGYGPEDLTAARGWAVAAGVSDGTAPGGDVTRQQLVTLIWRAMGEPEGRDGVLAEYPDLEAVSPYAREAMAWAVENGIIGGTTQGTLYPAGTATRAQLAAILHRYAGPGESWGNSLKTGCGGRQQPPGHLI